MAAAMPLEFPGIQSENDEICTIEATVVTGMETIAAEECLEKLQAKSMQARGRIIFDIQIDNIHQVFTLRSVDNVYVVMGDIKRFDFPKQKEEALQKLEGVVNCLDWKKGICVWQKVSGYKGAILPVKPSSNEVKENETTNILICEREMMCENPAGLEDTKCKMSEPKECSEKGSAECNEVLTFENCHESSSLELHVCDEVVNENITTNDIAERDKHRETVGTNVHEHKEMCREGAEETESKVNKDKCLDGGDEVCKRILRFRVTCNRAGNHHSFGSPDAAGSFGSAIIDKFGWKADMTKFNVEVMLNISDEHVYAGIALTTESLHKRNIKHFGPTTLRSTIAYNMLRMAHIADGEVVCDPMCGGGSIPIEGAISWPKSHYICGDLHELAWNRTKQNVDAVNETNTQAGLKLLKVDIFKWDVCCLPLLDNSVDVFVTDMPFGKRSGSKMDNRKLYPQALREIGRISKAGTGRAVILTQDKKNMIQTLQRLPWLWRNPKTLTVNIGGLAAGIFYLTRTSKIWR